MASDAGTAVEHHVSGLYTHMLLDSLAERLSVDAIQSILERAGETRSIEELNTVSSWSSYDQFKRLLQDRTGFDPRCQSSQTDSDQADRHGDRRNRSGARLPPGGAVQHDRLERDGADPSV
jgi:hypothetical protein